MAIFIRSNRESLYGRYFSIFFLIGAYIFLFYVNRRLHLKNGGAILLCSLIAIVLLSLFNLVQLIYLPINVTIDDSKLILKFSLRASITVSANEIESYNSTQISTRYNFYDGVIANQRNGKKIQFSDFNLKDSKEIKLFLKKFAIPFLGEIKFKSISYYRHSI